MTDLASLVPMAERLARRYSRTDDEYISAAYDALLAAPLTYSAAWGISLATHAYRCIRRALHRFSQRRRHVTNVAVDDVQAAPDNLLEAVNEADTRLAEMRWVEGMTLKEIAAVLQQPYRKVKQRLDRIKDDMNG